MFIFYPHLPHEAFYHFFSTLVKLEPSLIDIIAIGTDGDPAMEKAIGAVFPDTLIHLRCFIHMKDNIRRKLTELLLPPSVRCNGQSKSLSVAQRHARTLTYKDRQNEF